MKHRHYTSGWRIYNFGKPHASHQGSYPECGGGAEIHAAHRVSWEVGKYADFIVLDANPFEIPVSGIGDIKVKVTVFNGDQVFQQP
ncbi:hypothetical protein GCM10027217_12090 [Pseudomaricurvus hydrocarbonicus]